MKKFNAMKKLFLCLAMITVATSVWSATTGWKTVTKTSKTIAEEQSISSGSDKLDCPFDDAITFNHFKYYSDSPGQFRLYFQNNWSGSKFTMTAKTGVIIHSVKFTYSANANTILSDAFYWGGDGKTVPAEHRIISGTTYVIDATSKTFWVGITSGTSGSNVNITNIEIIYIYLPSPDLQFAETSKTVCKNAAAFVNPLQNKGNGTVEYSSDNTNVATVNKDNGTITIKGAGSTTISATVPATTRYLAGNTSFTLTVTDNLTPSPLAPAEYTIIKDVPSLANQYGWKTDDKPIPFSLNNAISMSASDGNAKYLNNTGTGGSDNNMRYYMGSNEGKIIVNAAKTGVIIKSAKFDYGRINNGVITSNRGENGKSVISEYILNSGDTKTVNANTVTLYTGESDADGNGQVRITKYTVAYTDPTIFLEKISAYTGGQSTQRLVGDNGVYKWRVTAQNRDLDIEDYKGIKLEYQDTIVSDTILEGGIKSVSFDWRTAGKDYPNHFFVKAGTSTDEVSIAMFSNTNYVLTYSHDFEIKDNTTLAIYNPAKESPQQNHIVVGHIHITPYLLFNVPNHAASFNVEDGTACDLNSALINNTDGGTISFDVIENTAGGNPSITDGILDFSSVVRTGTIKVQASWSGVTTTLTLTINLKDPQISFAKTTVTKMKTEGSYTQPLTSALSSGAVTYSLFSAPAGASINSSTGEVTFSSAGEYVVHGKVAAALPYAEDSASYTLTVTELIVPALKFDTSYVEKPVGADGFINTFSKPDDDTGAVTYKSDSTHVATVEENGDGTVTIVGAGTTTITASVAETSKYAAGNKSYTLKVFPLPVMSMGNDTSVYLNAPNFIRTASVTAGDGEITYSSSDDLKATVNASTGEVHIVGSGSVVITATMAKSANYWSGSANYNLSVSDLKMPTASFAEGTVNKVQGFASFTNTLTTVSDGVKTYESSDPRVATVNATTGEVTKGEKPGTTIITAEIAATAEWEKIEASYTLNVSSAPVADMHTVNTTVGEIKGSATWDDQSMHPNTPIDDAITLSNGKFYNTTKGGEFRYYYQNNDNGRFTIQAKAGVIIQSFKLTWKGNGNAVLTDAYYSGYIASNKQIKSDSTYKVDANALTFYVGITASGSSQHVNVTGYEITYFDPSQGVAVTKTAADLGKDLALVSDQCYQNVAINQAITMHADDANTMRYKGSGFDCYRHKGAIDIIARPGATIHYVKITYTSANADNFVLTKYFGTDGFNISAIDQIASDSILYVNAKSLKLYVGTPQSSAGWSGVRISKIYVNYSDSSVVTVDNFNNCTPKSGDSVVVAGVDGKYNWTFKNFARDNAQRMYYDQSVLINKGGKIMTEYTGGLQEVAFDWHPTESGKAVNFTVTAGDSSWNVTKTAAAMDKIYTFNFQKRNNKTNGEFSIVVDNASGTTVEVGHISLTPYILYTCKDTTIAAKDYKDAGWKFTNNTLINYTGETLAYSTSDASIAEVNASTGEVTIKSGGTVTISATAATAGVTASYQLKINLETTAVEFKDHEVPRLLTYGEYTQTLDIKQAPDTGRHVTYSIDGSPATASVDGNGRVTYTAEGNYTVRGRLEQNLPYAASEDAYVLSVTKAPKPNIKYNVDSLSKDLHDAAFRNELSSKAGVGDTTYLSTNEDVATVDATGWVTIVGTGKTTIKAMVAENRMYAPDTASYLLYVLPLPQMTFANSDTTVYLNATTFTNTLTVTPDSCVVSSYESSNSAVASVDANGVVTRGTSGTAIITAKTTKNKAYSAGSASYNVTVVPKYMTTASFQNVTMEKYQNDEPFSNPLTIDPQSDGARTYSSSDEQVATVTNEGVITMRGRVGKTTITANVEGTATYLPCSATFELTAKSASVPGTETVTGNIATIATAGGWQNNQYRTYFKIDDIISVSSAENNSQYSSSDKSVRFYQATNKGQFTIRAKAGVIIQTVKFTYTANNNGVITNNYGTNGQSIAAANQYVSGTTYKVDGNKLVFYTGSTAAKPNADVHITGIEVKYFVPQEGIAETKKAIDLGKEHNLTEKQCYKDVALNNVITIHADATNTLKYFATGFNCYRHTGSIDINARPGTTIHYVKITYAPIEEGYVLTKYWGTDGCNIPEKDQIASDSILYVNANSLKLRVGYANSTMGWSGVAISKIYVLYSDATAIVDDFDNCIATYGGAEPTEVAGVDGVYNWNFTQFNRDSLRRIGYDQSTMLRNGDQLGKIETVSDEGGVKEVSFDWCASNSNQAVKFDVKVGTVSETVQLAATGGWYPRTYTKTGVKQNGKFSIEVNSESGSQLEINHISMMPYLLYTTKEAILNLKTDKTFQMAPQIDNRDDEAAITYSIVEDVTFASIHPTTGLVTATDSGRVTIKAAWSSNPGVYTTYTLKIMPNTFVINSGQTVSTDDMPENATVTINNGGTLNVDGYTPLGSVYAKEGSQIIINASYVTINNFYISATMSATGTSGQIAELGDDQLHITGAAYFDLTINQHAEGKTVADQWHAFTVPFPVDAINGIFNAADGSKLANEVDYAIMDYHGDVRAQGKYGWSKYRGILQPGTFYIMTINGDVETFRMKMYGDGFTKPATSLPVHQYAKSGLGEDTDAGWNGIGNSQLNYRYVNATVQVLDPSTYTYVQKTPSDAAHFSVGTSFFYQASAEGSIELETSAPSSVAARAMSNEIKEVAVTLANEKYTDRLLLSSTEDATNDYQIGRDLAKMSMTNTPSVPQIFGQAYDTKLCIIDLPMANDEVSYSVLLYAPKTGEYTIAVAQVEGYQVFLTKDGTPIWDLTMGDAKVALAKGNTNGYGIVIKKAHNTPTGVEKVWGNGDDVQKFILNDVLYIVREGKVFNAQGKIIK